MNSSYCSLTFFKRSRQSSFAFWTSFGSGPLVELVELHISCHEYLRNMKVHRLVTLSISGMLQESRAASFDLNTASSLLLNMLDILPTMTDNLSTKIKAGKRFEIDRNLLFRPFALFRISVSALSSKISDTYSTKLISLDLFWLSPTETSLIN